MNKFIFSILTSALITTGAFAGQVPASQADFLRAASAWEAIPPTGAVSKFGNAYQEYKGYCVKSETNGYSGPWYSSLGSKLRLLPDPIRGINGSVDFGLYFAYGPYGAHLHDKLTFPIPTMFEYPNHDVMTDTGTCYNPYVSCRYTPSRKYFAVRMGDGNPVQMWARAYTVTGTTTTDIYCYYWNFGGPAVVVPPPVSPVPPPPEPTPVAPTPAPGAPVPAPATPAPATPAPPPAPGA